MNSPRVLKFACLVCAAMLQAATSGAQPVTHVAAGGYHSLFLKSGGSLWAMGYNGDGEFGDGTTNNANLPERIVASNVTAIAAGGYHSLFLMSDGSLWAMGYNGTGELGDGTYNNTNRPEQIVSSNVTAIAVGYFHSLFLKRDGSLWAMGNNGSGQLGDGTLNSTNRPEQIVSSNVTAIAAGGYFSLFLKTNGSLWAMGYNGYGELGDGTYNNTNRPEQIVASNVTAIAAGGGSYYDGYSTYYTDHSLFLKRDGSLWAMGNNGSGQLGDGTFNSTNRPERIVSSNVTAIAAGLYHSLFLKTGGSLWAMGWNANGQLGDGTYGGTAGCTNQPEQILASGVTAVAAGHFHSLFLKSGGSLWATGYNGEGELGDGAYGTAPDYGPSSPEQILAAYNQIFVRLLGGTNIQLSFVGIAGTNYALDRSFSLSPANWIPQLTNPAGPVGALVFTNTPNPNTNNFWRIRPAP
jgi:alpha-tubulin suppressor-like RCC1 family protein